MATTASTGLVRTRPGAVRHLFRWVGTALPGAHPYLPGRRMRCVDAHSEGIRDRPGFRYDHAHLRPGANRARGLPGVHLQRAGRAGFLAQIRYLGGVPGFSGFPFHRSPIFFGGAAHVNASSSRTRRPDELPNCCLGGADAAFVLHFPRRAVCPPLDALGGSRAVCRHPARPARDPKWPTSLLRFPLGHYRVCRRRAAGDALPDIPLPEGFHPYAAPTDQMGAGRFFGHVHGHGGLDYLRRVGPAATW